MPFRKKKNKLDTLVSTGKQTKVKKQTCREKNGTRDLNLRTKLRLPIYLLPSCLENVISAYTIN